MPHRSHASSCPISQTSRDEIFHQADAQDLSNPGTTIHGGDGRVRTDDPLLAKQVLSQLSYAPLGNG